MQLQACGVLDAQLAAWVTCHVPQDHCILPPLQSDVSNRDIKHLFINSLIETFSKIPSRSTQIKTPSPNSSLMAPQPTAAELQAAHFAPLSLIRPSTMSGSRESSPPRCEEWAWTVFCKALAFLCCSACGCWLDERQTRWWSEECVRCSFPSDFKYCRSKEGRNA